MEENKVSVIIPIYKVEKFIERCVRSLMEQTLKEVEYIFVDDATPDKSIDVLESCLAQYPERKATILKHPQNQGLPAARNTGLALATGEYVFHCDSDDYVEPTMLEELYNAAQKNNADIVWCDWFLTFAENERYMKQPSFETPMEALKAMLSGGMKYNVWNKLVRCSLYTNNEICFPTGHGMGEDMTMIRLFACAHNVVYLPKGFYHYVKLNGDAFTSTFSEKHLRDIKYNVDETANYLYNKKGDSIIPYLSFFKLNVKYPFIISDKREMYKLWKEWYPESNDFIGENKTFSLRSKMLQYAAKYGQYWILWLHYKLVYQFVYGILYR